MFLRNVIEFSIKIKRILYGLAKDDILFKKVRENFLNKTIC